MNTRRGWVQGYTAQLVVTPQQIILASEVITEANDVRQLQPMRGEAQAMVELLFGEHARLTAAAADAGSWSEENAASRTEDCALVIPTRQDRTQRAELRETASPRWRMPKGLSARRRLQRGLRTKRGWTIHAKPGASVEPVFSQMSQMKETARALDRSACAASARAGASGICSPPCTTCASCTGSLSGTGLQTVGWTKSRRGGPEMPEGGPPQAAPGADDAPIRPLALIARQPLQCLAKEPDPI
jgi:hypothetical protein